jgi:hypothetical protein
LQVRTRFRSRQHGAATEQIRDIDLAHPGGVELVLEQLDHAGHGPRRDAGGAAGIDDAAHHRVRDASDGDDHFVDAVGAQHLGEIANRAEHRHILDVHAPLRRLVIEKADGEQREPRVAARLADDIRPDFAGPDDQHPLDLGPRRGRGRALQRGEIGEQAADDAGAAGERQRQQPVERENRSREAGEGLAADDLRNGDGRGEQHAAGGNGDCGDQQIAGAGVGPIASIQAAGDEQQRLDDQGRGGTDRASELESRRAQEGAIQTQDERAGDGDDNGQEIERRQQTMTHETEATGPVGERSRAGKQRCEPWACGEARCTPRHRLRTQGAALPVNRPNRAVS